MNAIVILFCGVLLVYYLVMLVQLDRQARRDIQSARIAAVIRRITGPWD